MRLCMRLRSEDKHHLRKSADWKAQISPVSGTNAFRRSWLILCFFDLQIFWGDVYPPSATSRTISLFLFPIVFSINLIHFFDEKNDFEAGNSIVCFGASIPCHAAIWQRQNEECKFYEEIGTVSKSATFLATESVNSAPFKREKLRCKFLARKSAKLIANFSATVVTSLPSISLSLSLSLSHTHTHLAHNIGSASALPIIGEKGAYN